MLGKPIQMPAGRDKWLIRAPTMKGSHQLSEGLSQKYKDTLPKKKRAKRKQGAPATPFFPLIYFFLFDWVGFFLFPVARYILIITIFGCQVLTISQHRAGNSNTQQLTSEGGPRGMSGWGTARILNTCNRSGHLDFGGSRFPSVNSEFAASSFYKVGPCFFMSNKLLVSPKESHDFP